MLLSIQTTSSLKLGMRVIQDETYMLTLLKFSHVVAKILLHVLFFNV